MTFSESAEEEEPPKPSTRLSDSGEALASISAKRHTEPAKLTKLVRGELDWIVMKCLEKDRGRRYETANAFAADVQRYLADETVLACPPSAGYRFRKFARRNRTALVAAAIILAAIIAVAGSVGWVVKDRQAQQSMTRHEVETALIEATRLLPESRWAEALTWVARAEGVLAHGAGDEELRRRVRNLRADLEMVQNLEEVRLRGAEVKNEAFHRTGLDPAYQKAFRDYGIDVVALDPAEAAKLIRARNIHVELAAALDDWASVCSRTGDSGRRREAHLVNVAFQADSDPWRNRLRHAVMRADRKALEELANSEGVSNLGPASICLLARRLPAEHAVPLLRQAQRRHPADIWINHELGIRLYGGKQWGEAARFYTAAAALRPHSPGAHFNVGNALLSNGLLDEAIPAFQEAIRLKPDYAAPHSNLGNALRKKGKLDEAITCYRQAIRLEPENFAPDRAYTYFSLGIALQEKGRVDEAAATFREGIRLQREVIRRHRDLAVTHHDLGKLLCYRMHEYDGAIAALREAVRLAPNEAKYHFDLGNALRNKRLPDEALQAYREAVRHNSRYAAAHNGVGSALYDKHDYDGAVTAFREAVRLAPNDALYRNNLGNALLKKGQLGEALDAYREAVRLNPDARALNKLAWLLSTCSDIKHHRPAEALELAKKAEELDPKNPLILSTLAVAHYRSRDWKPAVAALEKSMALRNGGDSYDWFFLAMAHWQLKNRDVARKWYDKAIEWMDKNNPSNDALRRFRAEASELLRIEAKKD